MDSQKSIYWKCHQQYVNEGWRSISVQCRKCISNLLALIIGNGIARIVYSILDNSKGAKKLTQHTRQTYIWDLIAIGKFAVLMNTRWLLENRCLQLLGCGVDLKK